MKSRTRCMFFIATVLILAASPAQAQCALAMAPLPVIVISNEGPGYLITELINAGHGGDSPYQVVQFLASLPQAGSAIPQWFVLGLQNQPAMNPVHNTYLTQYSAAGAIAISGDGNVQGVSITSGPYVGQSGATTISTGNAAVRNVGIVFSGSYIANPNTGTPLTGWTIVGGCPYYFSYDVFAIAWALPDSPAATPAPPSLWLAAAGCLVLLGYTLWPRRRPVASAPLR